MTEYVMVCTQCGSEWNCVTDEWLDDVAIRGHYECSGCGATGGLWMDGGTVDLDEIRAATPSDEVQTWIGPTVEGMLAELRRK